MKKVVVAIIILFLLTSCERMYIVLSGDKPTIEIKGGRAYINGILGKRFYKKFKKFVEKNPDIKDLVLEKIPGSANDEWNVKSCLLIHNSGMNTEVTKSSVIESGGVDLFISGNFRTIEKGAKIGVHSWSDLRKEGTEYPRGSEEHDIFLDFFEQIGMDTAFYWLYIRSGSSRWNALHDRRGNREIWVEEVI